MAAFEFTNRNLLLTSFFNTNDEDKNCELKPGKIDSQSTTPKKEHGKSKKTKDNVSSNEIFDEKKMGKISEESSVITKKQEKNGSNTSIVVSKKQNSAAYQKYLQRSGPKNPNSKTIPKGTSNCLQNLTFVITGILDSLEKKKAVELIQKYGGRVTTQVSKKTDFIVVGEEPGESKLSKAEKFCTKKINEDELLALITERSNFKQEESKPIEKTEQIISNSSMKSSINENKKMNTSKSVMVKSNQFDDLSLTGVTTKSEASLIKNDDCKNNFENSDILWVEKYKPKSTKAIIGQGGEKSNVKKLTYWLQNWHLNHSTKNDKKLTKPAPWNTNDDGSYFKAALLSGPPGVGKTTSAYLICQELGFDIVEFNASDTRSKRLLQEEVSDLLTSKSLQGYFDGNRSTFKKQVLLMDEVDGMSGNEDRGGVQELIQLIKQTKIPIIGICNDRNHPKMRSLVNYCFDIRFQRPPIKQIKAAMLSICFKEKINISGDSLEELIVSSNHDLRQVLHRLSLLTFVEKSLSEEDARKNSSDGKKPLNLNPWDVVRKVFSASDNEKFNLNEKMDLFFQDYSLGPLFVQDAYIHVKPKKARNSELEVMSLISKAADSICYGDVVEKTIRSKNSWNLLPAQGLFASICPGYYMAGHFQGKIEFPAWMGKNSKARKLSRILQELHTSLCTKILGDVQAINLDYLKLLKTIIVKPLIEENLNGVPTSVKFMVEHNINKDDFDHILELCSWPGFKDSFSSIDSKIKSAFTRTLNKENQKVSCVKKTSKMSQDNLDDENITDDIIFEENDNIDFDPLIKKGKSKVKKDIKSPKETKMDKNKRSHATKETPVNKGSKRLKK
ncbi:Replication factor C subunit, putative [Pediculus humanus corporis]|uniref:Replication factor C subunit 1 n=1 Tax=Pediculus humanus subsp. corporis TaxID=121224 RepID=E0VKP6_PEDHC|nr:Replication factor C subunit, putative [Pediculus humanus corporis]EEB13952.1 Replication factor C subunit, putative [Pediculus humanus corporis]